MLCDFLCTNNLVQLITTPTHRQGNILDLIITNAPHRINNLEVNQPSLTTDHYLIKADILTATPCHINSPHQSHHTFRYLYSRADFDSLEDFLCDAAEQLCTSISGSTNVNVAWTNMKLMIEHARNLFVPRVKARSKPQPQWFNASSDTS